jgi:hypothetical protein
MVAGVELPIKGRFSYMGAKGAHPGSRGEHFNLLVIHPLITTQMIDKRNSEDHQNEMKM